jgi:hypothetical protein
MAGGSNLESVCCKLLNESKNLIHVRVMVRRSALTLEAHHLA